MIRPVRTLPTFVRPVLTVLLAGLAAGALPAAVAAHRDAAPILRVIE